jgi:hypothetical protein
MAVHGDEIVGYLWLMNEEFELSMGETIILP